jgi:hypothetical protein
MAIVHMTVIHLSLGSLDAVAEAAWWLGLEHYSASFGGSMSTITLIRPGGTMYGIASISGSK